MAGAVGSSSIAGIMNCQEVENKPIRARVDSTRLGVMSGRFGSSKSACWKPAGAQELAEAMEGRDMFSSKENATTGGK